MMRKRINYYTDMKIDEERENAFETGYSELQISFDSGFSIIMSPLDEEEFKVLVFWRIEGKITAIWTLGGPKGTWSLRSNRVPSKMLDSVYAFILSCKEDTSDSYVDWVLRRISKSYGVFMS